MAIDLFCYATKQPAEVQETIDALAGLHKGLFAKRFVIYKVADANPVHKEIALEYGLHARSEFMISLNDKSAADLVPTVLALIKCALGDSNVVIMSDGSPR